MNLSVELSDENIDELNAFLGRVKGGVSTAESFQASVAE
jgi:hypothetical protein